MLEKLTAQKGHPGLYISWDFLPPILPCPVLVRCPPSIGRPKTKTINEKQFVIQMNVHIFQPYITGYSEGLFLAIFSLSFSKIGILVVFFDVQ